MIPSFQTTLLKADHPISGRYRPKHVLGKGGMGWVVAVEDILLENQQLVLKFLFGHLVKSEKALSGFRNEVLIARRLIHPGIVRTHNFSQDDQFGHFIVMEYVPGVTLKERIGTGEQQHHSAEFILRILRDLLLAVSHAHSLGIIHLDIKPENIFLTEENELKLGDFGLSQSIRNAKAGSGKMVGTPLYMAPEQFRGEILTQQTDIYSIGILLHHLIGGKPPFEAGSVYALGKMHMEEKLPSLRRKRPDLPEWLHALIEKCTEKSTSQRFRSVDEIITVMREMGVDTPQDQYTSAVLTPIEVRQQSNDSLAVRLLKNRLLRVSFLLCLSWFWVFSARRQRWLHADLLYLVIKTESFIGIEMRLTRSLYRMKAKAGDPFSLVATEDGAVEALVWSGAPLNQLNPSNGRPFLVDIAITGSPLRFVPLLLDAGADPNLTDPLGRTALHYLQGQIALPAAKLLIEHGADVNKRDVKGETPLIEAVRAGEFELVRLLVTNGADPLIRDNMGNSALSIGRTLNDARILSVLEHPSRQSSLE